ncbi:uncharacterized protein LOC110920381 [Helianthus annuus]|uniref:uncharacterized protein LOC110920381 n=1 Tax=Helianthus annuus TaxID=4232 RepID=UPI000B8F84B1|nr:uncharacterized protein LOC110920381 [Helianthus annuus]
MAPFEALYGRKCQPHVCWHEVSEARITGPELIQETTNKIRQTHNNLLGAKSRQKSYADKQPNPLEFNISDRVLLKVSPWKGVVRFGKKGKLVSCYVGPFKILERIGKVACKLELPDELGRIHAVLHVANLKKCLADEILHVPLPLEDIQIDESMHFVGRPVEVMDRDDK